MSKILSEHNYNGIDATIIADSKNEFGQRITSFVCTFPRIILAEVNTHRMFSRNSASSRAVPFKTMVERVENNPFIPIAWQKDHKGMQGTEYFTNENSVIDTTRARGHYTLDHLNNTWLKARDEVVKQAQYLNSVGVTKQLCNRLLEPFVWHTAIITATEFENFFHLRCPSYYDGNTTHRSKKDYCKANNSGLKKYSDSYWYAINEGQGEIHIMALAEAMWDAMNESKPKQLKAGEWHIPFGDKFDEEKLDRAFEYLYGFDDDWSKETISTLFEKLKVEIATARCARVSYLNFEGKDDYEADIKLHDRLSSMGHWSPFEHCARAMNEREYHQHVRTSKANTISTEAPEDKDSGIVESTVSYLDKEDLGWSRNFQGFLQYREMVE